MAEEIKIVVGADTSKLQAELKKAESELKAFQTQLNNTGDSKKIDELNKKIAETKNVIANIKTQIPPIELTVDNSQLIFGVAQAANVVENIPPVQVPISADTTQLLSGVAQAENIIESIPPVQVPITADPTQLIAGVTAAENQAQNIPPVNVPITIDVKQISAQLTIAENDLRAFTAELKNATNVQDVIKLQNSIGLLKTKIGDLKSSLGAADSGLKKVAGQTNSAAYAVTNLGRIVSDSAYGFIGIANNITPFIDSLAAAKREAAATGTSLGKNLISSLSGPGGLSLAFAAVTTAITFAQIGFSAWTRGAQKTKEAVDEIKKAQEDFAKSLDSAKASALSSGIALQSYVDVAKNSTLPIEQRNEALKKANDILGDHGKVLTLTSIATAEGTKEIELYTKALIAQAVATQYTNQIATATIDEIRLKKELTAAQNVLTIAKQKAAEQEKISQQAARSGIQIPLKLQEANLKLAQAQDIVNATQTKLSATTKLIASSTEEANKATIDATAAFGALGTKSKDGTDKAAKGTETLAQALAKFRKSLEATQATGISLGTPQFEINKDKIKEFEGILKKIIEKFNVDPKNKVYIKLEAELQALQDQQFSALLMEQARKWRNSTEDIPIPVDVLIIPRRSKAEIDLERFYREGLIRDLQRLSKKFNFELPLGTLGLNTEGLKQQLDEITTAANDVPDKFRKNVTENLRKSGAEVNKAWEKYAAGINDAATGFLTDAATNIAVKFGEALGAALTGGNFGDVFSGVFELLAGGIQSLGEQLIKIGFLAVIAQQAIAQLLANPFAAIAVGIAMVALGAALKNLTTQQRFATGTRYAPGGMALVGERGPEMINLPRGSQVIPAAQTSQMMGGMGGQVEVFGVLRGQDIFFSNKKYGQTYGRTT